MKSGIGSHESSRMKTDEWLTPPHILDALGEFDLDPCSAENRPWDTAELHLTKEDDGLFFDWCGRVWCNPPYGKETGKWLEKLADHGRGTALIFARTETKVFREFVWERASAILFLYSRLHFHHVDGTRAKASAGAPSCLVAYGEEDEEILLRCNLRGYRFRLKNKGLQDAYENSTKTN